MVVEWVDDDVISNDNEGFETSSKDDPNSNATTTVSMSVAEKIARRESRFVRCLRLGLFVVLLTASAIAATNIYFSLKDQEQSDFEEAFLDYSNKITTEFQSAADRCLGSIAALSTTITTITKSTNATWPFVTIPEYEAQVRHTLEIADVEAIAFAPIVTRNEKSEWENTFVPQNVNKWIRESMMSKQLYDGYINETLLSYQVYPYNSTINETERDDVGYFTTIFAANISPDENGDGIDEIYFDISTDINGPYLPLWQIAPFTPGIDDGSINFDMNTDVTFDQSVLHIVSQGKAAMGRYTTQGYGGYGDGNPTSGFYYPVLKDLPHNSSLGGVLNTLIFWLPLFSNILPQSAIGIVGVLGNSCNQTFTFRIDGATATYFGDNDLHDMKYDGLKQEVVSFLSLLTDDSDKKEYLGFPIDDSGCTYTLRIYPSYDLQQKYVTNTPIIASMVILLVFLGTSSLFLLYDRLVERRQRMVQKEAESSGAIVSSLFPAAYHERLMAAQMNNHNSTKESLLKSVLNRNGGDNTNIDHDQPIADLYPHCTVFFADIAGFTHWSSTREPVQVFCLLQEIFAAMDKCAKKFHIFKVETIGDCYMAVTGLPNPQANHAQLMSRFAADCLIQMRETTTRLMGKLGNDTADLTLRIGLHSGPVTAGILRGEKSRFQLFGDTVNTASRMESTGEKSRIQLSSTTADVLRQAGKGHWLQAREDLVDAKGKGKLQTYWLVYDCANRTSTDYDQTDRDQTEFEDRNTTPTMTSNHQNGQQQSFLGESLDV